MDQKWSHAKVLGKYFDVYGQACPITPEARKKKAPFSFRICYEMAKLDQSTFYYTEMAGKFLQFEFGEF